MIAITITPPMPLHTRFLDCVDYLPTYAAMQAFTNRREHSTDEALAEKNSSFPTSILDNQLWI